MIAKKMAATSQPSLTHSDNPQSAVYAAAQIPANLNNDSGDTMESDVQPSASDQENQTKQKGKSHKAKARSQKLRKLNKAERTDEKRERRQKKEQARKTYMAT